jgi:putative thiamine transport system substrate-binding protein
MQRAARGQTVYFNAWAGSERINAYLQWAGAEVERRHGMKLEHVKIADTAEVVKRVRAEKQAGRTTQGSADMVWINGENFLAMKRDGLLFGPFAEALPSYAWVDTTGKPTTRIDFSEPVDGFEAPGAWRSSPSSATGSGVPRPPRSRPSWWTTPGANRGRFTYPKPPNFHGTTFLKQVLLEASGDRKPFYAHGRGRAFCRAERAAVVHAGHLHPLLWRQGRQFPPNNTTMHQMKADGELLVTLTFNPNEAANEIAAKARPRR